MRYFCLTTKDTRQKIPYEVNRAGRLRRICGCIIDHIGQNKSGERFYRVDLFSDLDPHRAIRNQLNRYIVLKLSKEGDDPSAYEIGMRLNTKTCLTEPCIEPSPRLKVREISERTCREIKNDRSLRVNISFASARYHR